MAIFPPLNTISYTLVQLPYSTADSWENLSQDVETGMRFSYKLRGSGLPGYPTGPLGRFAVQFSLITDAEVATLQTFYNSVKGRYGSFAFLDAAGNLLKSSEALNDSTWTNTSGVTLNQPDPFRQNDACLLTAGYISSIVGPSAGGLSGFVVCASIWIHAVSGSTAAMIGFVDNTTSTYYSTTYKVGTGWSRIYSNLVLPTNNQFSFKLVVGASCVAFGAQVSPTKGESGYARTSGGGGAYGYHPNCRLDSDQFAVTYSGPNQNSVSLPIVEFNT